MAITVTYMKKTKYVWEYTIIDNFNKTSTGTKETVIEEADRFINRFVKVMVPRDVKELHLKFIGENS